MSDRLIVSVREERSAHSVLRTASLNAAAGSASIFFEISGNVLPPPLAVHDFAALAALFVAMREGRAMHVEGAVSEALLRNLEEFQEAWALWKSKYKPIRVTADRVVPPQPSPDRKGVFAVSGGVDSAFALLRHHGGGAGLRTAPPVSAMLVHGFDIPLDQQRAFDRARRDVAQMLSVLGIPLTIVRTNWRDQACADWPMEFTVGLAACLHQFQGVASVGVIGADEDYAHLELPWGSNPITNHLLSGGGFQLHTEGAGFTRTDRVRLICDYPEIASRLRVCWQGPMTGANCGRCEKCIRTKLNFMANRQEPTCFDDGLTHVRILGVVAQTPLQIAYLREVLASARRNGVAEPWMLTLALAIAKNRLMLPVRVLHSLVRGRLQRRRGVAPATGKRDALQVKAE